MQVNATRHCCVGAVILDMLRHSRVGGNLVEVPAFAEMTFLRWDDVRSFAELTNTQPAGHRLSNLSGSPVNQ